MKTNVAPHRLPRYRIEEVPFQDDRSRDIEPAEFITAFTERMAPLLVVAGRAAVGAGCDTGCHLQVAVCPNHGRICLIHVGDGEPVLFDRDHSKEFGSLNEIKSVGPRRWYDAVAEWIGHRIHA